MNDTICFLLLFLFLTPPFDTYRQGSLNIATKIASYGVCDDKL